MRDEDEAARLRVIAEEALDEAGLSPDTLGEAAPGAILRSAAEGVDEEAIHDDVAALAELLNAARAAQAGDDAPGEIVAAPDAVTRAWRDWVDPEPDEVIRGDLRLWDDMGALDPLGALLRPRVDPAPRLDPARPPRAHPPARASAPDGAPAPGLRLSPAPPAPARRAYPYPRNPRPGTHAPRGAAPGSEQWAPRA